MVHYVDFQSLREKLFGGVPGPEATSETIFQQYKEGSAALFDPQGGGSGWPVGAREADMLGWFGYLLLELKALAQNCNSAPMCRRKLLPQSKKPLPGSTPQRKAGIGIVDENFAYNPEAGD